MKLFIRLPTYERLFRIDIQVKIVLYILPLELYILYEIVYMLYTVAIFESTFLKYKALFYGHQFLKHGYVSYFVDFNKNNNLKDQTQSFKISLVKYRRFFNRCYLFPSVIGSGFTNHTRLYRPLGITGRVAGGRSSKDFRPILLYEIWNV